MLFAKNKPTERLTFGDDYIELQHLSKGVLDEIKSRSIKAFAQAGPEALKAMKTAKTEDDMPAEVLASSGEMLKIHHYKVANAIVKWSSEEPVNEDTVKALDEEVFMQVSAKVDEMTQLKATERKN
jgi:hypothetical protein